MEHKPEFFKISASSSSSGNPSLQLNVNQSNIQMSSKVLNFNIQPEQFQLESLLTGKTKPLPRNSSNIQFAKNSTGGWDAKAMLGNLSFLEQKIHQVQDVVRSIVCQKSHITLCPNELEVQQQLVTTDLTSIIVDLISTAGNLLPSIKNNLFSSNSPPKQLQCDFDSSTSLEADLPLPKDEQMPLVNEMAARDCNDCGGEVNESGRSEDNDMKESENVAEVDNLPLGSYEVLQLEKEEILAPHTHFCSICGKGFKRDANLRMHMRGHGDEYKSPAALAKPSKDSEPAISKRYSCPFIGCKRNKEHKNFQPLKSLVCVKNHYKRSHCEKSYMCSRCHTKKFSVLADLKTHEKHCGIDKWLCSCGTTFSRKDKLFGHVALFQGHAPALPSDESYGLGSLEHGNDNEVGIGPAPANFVNDVIDTKAFDGDRSYLSTLSFEPYDYLVSDEFMEAAFGLLENSSNVYPSWIQDLGQKKGETVSSSMS